MLVRRDTLITILQIATLPQTNHFHKARHLARSQSSRPPLKLFLLAHCEAEGNPNHKTCFHSLLEPQSGNWTHFAVSPFPLQRPRADRQSVSLLRRRCNASSYSTTALFLTTKPVSSNGRSLRISGNEWKSKPQNVWKFAILLGCRTCWHRSSSRCWFVWKLIMLRCIQYSQYVYTESKGTVWLEECHVCSSSPDRALRVSISERWSVPGILFTDCYQTIHN